MHRFLALSILLHIVVALLMYFGVPSLRRDVKLEYAIVMDIVPVSELTNLKMQKVRQKKEVEAASQEVKPVSAAQPTPPAPAVPPKPTESKKADAKPVEEKAEAVPDKKAAKEDKPKETKPETKEAKKVEEKKDDKDKKQTKERDIFSESFLKNMEAKVAKKEKDQKNKKEFEELSKSIQADTNKPYNDTMPLSISEIDAIRSQVQKAWNTAAFSGANSMGMQVTLYIKLDMGANVLDVRAQKMGAGSPYYQAFVDSAIRAVRIASPLKNLPKDKYGTWKEIEFVFDSSGMIY